MANSENVATVSMNILELHNYFRAQNEVSSLEEHTILMDYAAKTAKWMARRHWNVFWNFDKVRENLIREDFIDVDFNIAVGDEENIVIKHILNNYEKKEKLYNPTYKYIGYGFSETKYRYWCILYAY